MGHLGTLHVMTNKPGPLFVSSILTGCPIILALHQIELNWVNDWHNILTIQWGM